MPFSDIFVEALTKVSASRKAYLRHLYIKPACYEENALVSASEVFASKSDDSREIIPGSLRIVFRIPVPPVEIPEATASERPALRLIRRPLSYVRILPQHPYPHPLHAYSNALFLFR